MILCYINSMIGTSARFVLVIAVLLLVSCDQPAIDSSQSLVGARRLPSAKTLSREVIDIMRGSGEFTPYIGYELHPDNLLTIELNQSDRATFKNHLLGKQTVQLSSNVAARAQRLSGVSVRRN